MARELTPLQLEHIKAMFVENCRRAKAADLSPYQLSAALSAMAERLVGDNSPLERYINNPNGDNPKEWPV